ncbi:MAG: primosomal protein N' [Acidobacteria bacterium]|nr:primosomal protein N' [Acidobacteriota bacterium]MBI3656770.1 primosomal protein N' [Acidobacteriota bacterium]
MNTCFVSVAIPVALYKTLCYSVPQRLREHVQAGARVLAPLGPRKLVVGYVTEVAAESPPVPPGLMKDIVDVLDHEPLLTPELLRLTQWASDYYLAPWGMTIKAALPSGINVTSLTRAQVTPDGLSLWQTYRDTHSDAGNTVPAKFKLLRYLSEHSPSLLKPMERYVRVKSLSAVLNECEKEGLIRLESLARRAHVKEKQRWKVTLIGDGHRVDERRLTRQQETVLERLRSVGGAEFLAFLIHATGCSSATVQTLAKRGFVRLSKELMARTPALGETIAVWVERTLTEDQQKVVDRVRRPMDSGLHARFLLHGVTGSGKTEIYLRLIADTVQRGGRALMLVPEIALTPAMTQLFKTVFGHYVAILHSGLSEGERLDEWWHIRRGSARVAVGTRSAVFAPLQDLRLIIVDEEHDSSYKQDETPRYHARDLAIKRAALENAVVMLGSATPALETYTNATEKNKLEYLVLPSRILGRPMASVQIVDMRDEFLKFGLSHSISTELKEQIRVRLARREQTLILLNRRGYSHTILCRSCGNTIGCHQCSISMTWHRTENHLLCHYCNATQSLPDKCTACGKAFIYYLGEGTERIQEILQKLFPQAGVDRMDHDTTRKKGAYQEILSKVARGETDILVGTQMIAKGHDFHNVTLVGVIAADTGLSFPDFRTAERTFQLITQVAGRAGRGDAAGAVVIQTFYPNHYALKAACRQDYQAFYEEERRFRQLMHYPPFVSLANVLIKDKSLKKVIRTSQRLAAELREIKEGMTDAAGVRVMGPAPAPLEKIRGEYRYQILIKSPSRAVLREILERSHENLRKARAGMKNVAIDVDPMNIL